MNMFLFKVNSLLLLVVITHASYSFDRTGWLDKIVGYYKRKFYQDVMEIPVDVIATIEPTPLGYEDSEDWDYESVVHLLVLIKESKTAKPVRRALRRMLQPSRRLNQVQKSFICSLHGNHPNEFYYDIDTDDYYADASSEKKTGFPDDDAVIVVSNPVEARLPSAQISVRLLRDILESRAKAARIMPTTKGRTFSWKTTAKGSNTTTKKTGDKKEKGTTSPHAVATDATTKAHAAAKKDGTTGTAQVTSGRGGATEASAAHESTTSQSSGKVTEASITGDKGTTGATEITGSTGTTSGANGASDNSNTGSTGGPGSTTVGNGSGASDGNAASVSSAAETTTAAPAAK